MSPTAIRIFIMALSTMMVNGCAIMKDDNRILLNSLDRSVEHTFISDTTAGRIAALPVFVPVATAAVAADAAILTPARAFVPAVQDTYSCLWENPKGSDLRRLMLIPPKIASTPIMFAGDWAFRILFETDLSVHRRPACE